MTMYSTEAIKELAENIGKYGRMVIDASSKPVYVMGSVRAKTLGLKLDDLGIVSGAPLLDELGGDILVVDTENCKWERRMPHGVLHGKYPIEDGVKRGAYTDPERPLSVSFAIEDVALNRFLKKHFK